MSVNGLGPPPQCVRTSDELRQRIASFEIRLRNVYAMLDNSNGGANEGSGRRRDQSLPVSQQQQSVVHSPHAPPRTPRTNLHLQQPLQPPRLTATTTTSSALSSTTGSMTSPLPRRLVALPLAMNSMAQPDTGRSAGGSLGVRGTFGLDPQVSRRRRPLPDEWSAPGSSTAHENRNSDGAENERRFQEIMKLSGVLTIKGRKIQTSLDDIEYVGDLGHGTCGNVIKAYHKKSGHMFAVKQLRRTGNKDENKRVIMDLDVVLKSYDCPYIVKCYGCFITDCDVQICMELMATCLEKLKNKLRPQVIPEDILGKMAVSIIKALHFLQDIRIIHRDVKPSNMLLDWNGTIKLCDFGISGRLVDSKAKTRNAGCAAYMAPERIEVSDADPSKHYYDVRADVWSLGISMVELAKGRFPYEGCNNDFEVLTRVLQDDAPLLKPEDGFSGNFCAFIRDCLTKNYENRPKYAKLLKHSFIQYYDNNPVDVASWFAGVQTPSPDTQYNNNAALLEPDGGVTPTLEMNSNMGTKL